MSDKDNNAGAEPTKKDGEGQQPAVKKDETTISEALGTAPKTEPKAQKMVPEADLLAVKKNLKVLERKFNNGASQKTITEALSALKAKWPDNSEFIQEFSDTILKAVKPAKDEDADDDEDDEEEDEPKKTKGKKKKSDDSDEPEATKPDPEKVNALVKEHYTKTIAAMPEYKDIVTEAAFRALVTAPENANKTFVKIVEETFGHLVKGKGSIDQAKPGGGKDPAEIDYTKAAKDQKYLAEIMADPALKREYNKNLHTRLNL